VYAAAAAAACCILLLLPAARSPCPGTHNKHHKHHTDKQRKRLASFRTRTASTLLMILGFALIVYLGHVPLVALVFTLQFLMVKELFHLARVAQKDNSLPGFRAQQWYFFAVAAFYLYVRFIKANLLIEIATGPSGGGGQALSWVLKRHNIISYLLYMGGARF
jgi:phosphatidate cytidylyltransferase